jgi:hypothetical protein
VWRCTAVQSVCGDVQQYSQCVEMFDYTVEGSFWVGMDDHVTIM